MGGDNNTPRRPRGRVTDEEARKIWNKPICGEEGVLCQACIEKGIEPPSKDIKITTQRRIYWFGDPEDE
jgi:hypothetical protein